MGYSKEVYDRAWAELHRRAQQARDRYEAHRAEIDLTIPEIAVLERELAATAAGIARSVIAEPNRVAERIEELRRQNLDLQSRREQLLVQHGYPADYLAEQHSCPHCHDSGYIGTQMCGCLSGLLKQNAYRQLSESSRAGECGFDNFLLRYYPDRPDADGVVPQQRMAQILEFCRRYAAEFSPRAESLLLLGQTGLGKTHLSLAIASAVTEQGYGVVYTPVHKLLGRLEAEKFSRGGEGQQYLDSVESLIGCDLLVLDDLGTEFHTQFTASVLYNIINSRLVEDRPTIISTNLDLAQIEEKYSQRMVSRLVCSYRVLKFCGKDIRYMKKAEQLA